jgi:hypothetical protein
MTDAESSLSSQQLFSCLKSTKLSGFLLSSLILLYNVVSQAPLDQEAS